MPYGCCHCFTIFFYFAIYGFAYEFPYCFTTVLNFFVLFIPPLTIGFGFFLIHKRVIGAEKEYEKSFMSLSKAELNDMLFLCIGFIFIKILSLWIYPPFKMTENDEDLVKRTGMIIVLLLVVGSIVYACFIK